MVTITTEELLAYFNGAKKRIANGYNVVCPCHNDKEPSLSITDGGDKILMHCQAGCRTEDILAQLGLKSSDLFYTPIETTSNWKKYLEGWKNKSIIAHYKYKDKDNNYLYSKIRFEDKSFIYGVLDKEKDFFKFGGIINHTLYNLPYLLQSIKKGYTVYIVEGEKDVHTLSEMGYCATTCGGVSNWKKEYSQYFKGAKVIILPDNDEAGKELADRIKKDIKLFAHSIQIGVISKLDKGDITDYITRERGTNESFIQFINSLNTEVAPWIYFTEKGSQKINQGILADSISKSMDYIMINHRGTDKKDIYIYKNGMYEIATKDEVKGAIREYLPISITTNTILDNVYNLLRTMNNKTYSAEELNASARYINLKNGLYDIEQDKLISHTPNILSTIQLNCNYLEEDTSQPTKWLAYINDLCRDEDGNTDKQKVDLLQEWFGLLISNIPVHKVKSCLILYSSLGNTGKSVFLRIITHLLGTENTVNIPIQDLSKQFSLSGLYGKRVCIVGDQQSNSITDSSVFKQITGGDSLDIEFKGKTKFSYTFNGGMLFACNNLPAFTDDKGGHIFDRLCIVPCVNVISKDKANNNLSEELLLEKDLIFAWALDGLRRLIKNDFKFTVCQASKDASEEFRKTIDTIYDFITENYKITDNKMDRVKKTEFEERYASWCRENERQPVSKRNIKERMEKIGCPYKKSSGEWYYQYLIEDPIEDVQDVKQVEIDSIFPKGKA